MRRSSTRDVNNTYEGITLHCDVNVLRCCRHLLDYATLVAVDIMARAKVAVDITPPHPTSSSVAKKEKV